MDNPQKRPATTAAMAQSTMLGDMEARIALIMRRLVTLEHAHEAIKTKVESKGKLAETLDVYAGQLETDKTKMEERLNNLTEAHRQELWGLHDNHRALTAHCPQEVTVPWRLGQAVGHL